MPATTKMTIDEHIGKLPQELQDEILEYYLILPKKLTINKSYKPAPQLQISRKIRAAAAARLYSATTKIFFTDEYDVCQWLHSLSLPTFKNMRLFYHCDPKRNSIPTLGWGLDEKDYIWSASRKLSSISCLLNDIDHRDNPKIAVGEGKSEMRGNVVAVDIKTGKRKRQVVYQTRDEMHRRYQLLNLLTTW